MKNDRPPRKPLSRRQFLRSGAGAAVASACMSASLLGPGIAAAAPAAEGGGRAYVCPPCGLPCDKRTVDAPGRCPNCGMTLVPAAGEAGSPPAAAILLFNGAQLIDFAGPWEVFGTAGLRVHTVAERAETLTAVFGEKVVPDFTFANSPKADVLLVPGGGVWDEVIHSAPLLAWIRAKASEARYVMSVCTGAFLLQKAGLLAGHTVTTTYGMIDDLRGPDTSVVFDRRFVESGKVITTAGLSAGIDGALHVVAALLGEGPAQSTALEMEYDWDPAGRYARAAFADRFLPDGLAFSKPNVKGARATMISTAGDRDHWKTKILVSEPRSLDEVRETMRRRIEAGRASSGMFRPVSHMRGAPVVTPPGPGDAGVKWTFSDEEGRPWAGSCTVEPGASDSAGILVTFDLARVPGR